MDALSSRWCQGLCSARNITVIRARERADNGFLDGTGDGLDRFKVTLRRRRKASFDDIDLEPLKLTGDADFFFACHRRTGRLLAVAQGGVKNDELV